MSRTLWSFTARSRKATAFTLLELLIVLVVLMALAALVVPLLGWARKQAEYASAAAGAAEALNNLEIYRASTGKYPERFDSLLNAGGTALYLTNSAGASVWPSTEVNLGNIATVATSTDMGIISYYLTNDGALTSFVNHSGASQTFSGPNTSTEASQVYTVNGQITAAVTNPGPDGIAGNSDDVVESPAVLQAVAKVVPGATASTTGTLARLIRACYPSQATATIPTIPTGSYLIAVGIGGRNSAVGSTMSSPPQYAGADAGKYGRFIAFFDVSPGPTGRGRVQLKCVTDPTFTTIAQNTDRYKAAGASVN